ncbi:MAG: hypothetical protein JW966_11190 [Anaerolineae bacterium]|nr:hypothetical protein [Anaerolineae bacterium]
MAEQTPTQGPNAQKTAQNAAPGAAQEAEEQQNGRSWYFWPVVGLIALVVVFLVALIGGLLIALLADPDDAANWVGMIRDLFIIVLAMEGMLMGIALIVLVLQVAALLNLLQNEVGPIVDHANETASTVRGTAQFMSENLVEPVVKAAALTTGVGAMLRELLGIRRALRMAKKNGQAARKLDE